MEYAGIAHCPSDERRRLSGILSTDVEETIKQVSTRRRSSIKDIVEGPPSPTDAARQSGGARSRRTSIITEFFARSSTSPDFREKHIRPTVVFAMMHFREAAPDVEKLRAVLADRLLEIPRFCAVFREEEKGRVHFVRLTRDQVDLEYHISSFDGKGQFGEKELSDMITQASLEWWDLDRPLWQLTLVRNMEGGRSVLLCKVDHSIGDGVALSSALLSLLDDPPEGVNSFQQRRKVGPSVPLSQRVVSWVYGCYFGIIGWALTGFDPENGLKILRGEPLSKLGRKSFSKVKAFSLDSLKDMKNRLPGTTVNDLILAIVTIGIRHYLEKTDDNVLDAIWKGKDLHMNFVVNTRDVASASEKVTNLGNDFALASLAFALRYTSNIDCVWRSKANVDVYKVSPALYLAKNVSYFVLQGLPEEAIIAAAIDNNFKPTCFFSNVMGPSFESAIAGYTVDDLNFTASANIGLYFGIISYNNKVRISFTTDKLAAVDCGLLKDCLESAFDSLEEDVRKASPEELKPPRVVSFAAKVLEVAVPAAGVALLSYLWFVASSSK